MHATDPMRLAVARLHALPWEDADRSCIERELKRRAIAMTPAGLDTVLRASPALGAKLSRSLAGPPRAAATACAPRSTAGAVFLLASELRTQVFWAVGLLAFSELWRTTVRRAEVQQLEALLGSATSEVRGWLDGDADRGIALVPAPRLAELGSSPATAYRCLVEAGVQVLMRLAIAADSRGHVRAVRWRAPLGDRSAWRGRVRLHCQLLEDWLANELILAQGPGWQWMIAPKLRRADASSTAERVP